MTNRKKLLLAFPCVILLICLILIGSLFFGKGARLRDERAIILIPTGATYEQVLDTIYSNLNIRNKGLFEWISKKKSYPSIIRPGRYIISNNLSYIRLINILRSGWQIPVNVTFNNINTIYQLAGKAGGQIEADSLQIITFLNDLENYSKDGFTMEDIISVFIPDTYEFYWNTSASGFYSRMLKEYRRYWTDERSAKARAEKLTRIEVSILASIVDAETSKKEEKPRIAGVYLNRLKRGMPLQADPTIKFALNDFSINRILYKQLQTNSPYNTYKHTGLPPGPIGCPTEEGLEAVLNAEKHDYLYFVARADNSGLHIFSRTLAEHNRYSAEYQKELDKRKIFR